MDLVAGADIGGSHITAGLVNIDNRKLMDSSVVRKHINPAADSDTIIREWCDAILDCHTTAGIGIQKIGIAMPGPFDYANGISYIKGLHKYENLYELNVKSMMAKQLQVEPAQISFKNDAQAFMAGELFCGCAVGCSNVVGITLGTGLGSATYYNNEQREGDLYCMPFREGMAEDYISSRWFVFEYKKLTGATVKGVKELADRMHTDPHAAHLFGTFGATLAEVLLLRYKDQNPGIIFIGGNIAHAWDCFIPSAVKYLEERNSSIKLTKAILGERAALIGACCG